MAPKDERRKMSTLDAANKRAAIATCCAVLSFAVQLALPMTGISIWFWGAAILWIAIAISIVVVVWSVHYGNRQLPTRYRIWLTGIIPAVMVFWLYPKLQAVRQAENIASTQNANPSTIATSNQMGGINNVGTIGSINVANPVIPGWTITRYPTVAKQRGLMDIIEIEPVGKRLVPWLVAVPLSEKDSLKEWGAGPSGYVPSAFLTINRYQDIVDSPEGKLHLVAGARSVGERTSVYLFLREPISRLWIGTQRNIQGKAHNELEPVPIETAKIAP